MTVRIRKTDMDALISCLNLSGKWGLCEAAPLTGPAFLDARSSWMASGICGMDFDGKLYFHQPYLRLFYNLMNVRAAIRYTEKTTGTTVWCCRGPVDLLWVKSKKDSLDYELSRSANSSLDMNTLAEWGSRISDFSVFRELDAEITEKKISPDELSKEEMRLRICRFFFAEV